MNPLIKYKNGQFQCYKDIPLPLAECPFPLKTDSFEVVEFGKNLLQPREEKHGRSGTYAHVIYTKKCGHKVLERIPFFENVQDFNSYGTPFFGIDYSLVAWQTRIEFFRTIMRCDVCRLSSHLHWCYREKLCLKSFEKQKRQLIELLDYSYENWREFLDPEVDFASPEMWRGDPNESIKGYRQNCAEQRAKEKSQTISHYEEHKNHPVRALG